MSNISKEFLKLNFAQKDAVDSIDGPVLVIAGPGTGKTQLLSMRVANILRKTDTQPHEILCLTFTEKAATNMRDRLIGLIGHEAHGVVTKTFHSFGAEIINSYPDYFWQAAKPAPAPDVIQYEVVHSILKRLRLSNPLALRFGGNPTLTKDVKDALKYTKEAGLTPDKLRAIVEANIAYLETIEEDVIAVMEERITKKNIEKINNVIERLPEQNIRSYIRPLQPLSTLLKETFQKAYNEAISTNSTRPISNWKRYWVQKDGNHYSLRDEKKRNLWWLELASVYEKYRKQLYRRGYFDYSDMLIEVIMQLEQNEELRSLVQERFLYVLIDEFQDTNEAQMRLAHLVADHHFAEGKPNIMVVGDDDQTIYKFQGAQTNNLLNFHRSYPSAKIVVLEKNYRSHQSVLNVAQEIIEQAEFRLVSQDTKISKYIFAAGSHSKGEIEFLIFTTKEAQFQYLAKKIKQRFKQDKNIAVIARTHESLRQFANILQQYDIPVRYEQRNNVLVHPITQIVVHMARLVNALNDGNKEVVNEQLAIVLRHPMWNIKLAILWNLALKNRERAQWLESIQRSTSTQQIADYFFDLARESQIQPLAVMLDMMLGLMPVGKSKYTSPLREYYIKQSKPSNEYLTGLSAIHLLRTLVNEISQGWQASLKDFLDFSALHEENNIVIADESIYVSASNAVELLTAHKAKGLEFNSVYVVDCIENDWSPSSGYRKPPINLPLKPAGDEWDDYVRLMFVSATRAVSNLIFSAYRENSAGKGLLPTPILSSVFKDNVRLINFEAKEATTTLETALSWPKLNKADEKHLLAPIIENYSLSITHLVNFLDVTRGGPQYFYERNLLKLPEAKTPSQAYGSAMHDALELAQKLVNNNSFNLKKIENEYIKSLENQHIEHGEFERFKDEGIRILNRFFSFKGAHMQKGSRPERTYKNIVVGNANLNGKFDRIDFSDNTVTIIDYKTGKPLSNIKTMSKNEGIKAWKQRTQLIFYAIIARNQPEFRNKNIETQMIYAHAETEKQLMQKYRVTEEDIKRLEKLINSVWNRIMHLNFPDTSTYSNDLKGILQFEQDLISRNFA
ncbi:ATP-dependent helicase [Candidatus Saccharibacteria bacterium CPR2]|nr:ATP-dependent helicase [Candidatus Saccharibacteria bacterium CPR2]